MKKAYSAPIIASMHGVSAGVWLDFSIEIQDSRAYATPVMKQITGERFGHPSQQLFGGESNSNQ